MPKVTSTQNICNIVDCSIFNHVLIKIMWKKRSHLCFYVCHRFINELMFFIEETKVCILANDIRIYSCSPNFEEAILKWSNDQHLILKWFRIDSIVANPVKSQITFLASNIDNSKITFMIENKRVKSRSEVKLLGITIDDKLSFTTHIENLCNTASNHLRAFVRIRKFLSFE